MEESAMKAVWKEEEGLLRMSWELEDPAFSAFQRYGVVVQVPKGETIFRKGEDSDSLFLVLEGSVSIVRDGTVLGVIPMTNSFGEMGLLLGVRRSGDAIAAADSRLLEITRSDLDRMLEEEPEWAARLFKVLAECLAEYLHRAVVRSFGHTLTP
jgi:CRP-like cAMP-binding protein